MPRDLCEELVRQTHSAKGHVSSFWKVALQNLVLYCSSCAGLLQFLLLDVNGQTLVVLWFELTPWSFHA